MTKFLRQHGSVRVDFDVCDAKTHTHTEWMCGACQVVGSSKMQSYGLIDYNLNYQAALKRAFLRRQLLPV